MCKFTSFSWVSLYAFYPWNNKHHTLGREKYQIPNGLPIKWLLIFYTVFIITSRTSILIIKLCKTPPISLEMIIQKANFST